MAQRYTTYRSLSTVKARKVTAKDGEDVVTSNGREHAYPGDYVTEDGRIVRGPEFEATYAKPKKNARKKPSPVAEDAVPEVAGTKEDEKSSDPASADTAAARVKATTARRNAGA